jgi:hypothetical protein
MMEDDDEQVAPVSRNRLRRTLIRRTQELGPTEHGEIFKILSSHGIDHTQNSNGIFVNLSRVPDNVLDEVQRFVEYCVENKQGLDEYDKRLNECKRSQDYERFMGGTGEHDEATAPAPAAAVAPCQPPPSPPPEAAPLANAAADPVAPAVPADISGARSHVMVASVAKRILNSKFHQAKKKYSKRKVAAERKQTTAEAGSAAIPLLSPEPYLVT